MQTRRGPIGLSHLAPLPLSALPLSLSHLALSHFALSRLALSQSALVPLRHALPGCACPSMSAHSSRRSVMHCERACDTGQWGQLGEGEVGERHVGEG